MRDAGHCFGVADEWDANNNEQEDDGEGSGSEGHS